LLHYPFDGNHQDVGINQLHGTPINGPLFTTNATGGINSAIGFNGTNQLVELPNDTYQTHYFSSKILLLD
jgi:hypothetical protein